MNQTSTVQQPTRGNVTRIATSQDVREAAVIIAQQNGKLAARLTRIEAKLDRIIAIMQAASATATSSTTASASATATTTPPRIDK